MNLTSRRILVVEDDYLQAADMAQALQQAGADVAGPVPSVVEAIVELQTTPVDAAVLDLSLQGETSTLVAIALEARSIPFVVVSGCAAGEVAAFPAGPAIFKKPASAESVIEAIERLVARAA